MAEWTRREPHVPSSGPPSKAALLDAAVDLYSQLGPDGVSFREVARSAGFSHALVARYFGSKQGLMSAVKERLAAEVRTVMDSTDLSSPEAFLDLLTGRRSVPRG